MDEREDNADASGDDSVEIPVNVVDDEEGDASEEASEEDRPNQEAGSSNDSGSSDGSESSGGGDESSQDDAGSESDDLFVEADDADVEVVDTGDEGSDALSEPARERIDELEERLDEVKQERDQFEERMMRIAADLENFKKRAKRNEEELEKYGSKSLVSDLLPTIDNLERALEHARNSEEANIIDGVEMVVRQLHQQLEKHGVAPFDATGETFDPERHEAIQQVETSDHESGEVIEQFQRGYMIHDRLLRPAMVSVAKQVEESDDEETSEDESGE